MNYFWQHVSGKKISPRFSSPEDLTYFSDQYFEDYCIVTHDALMLKTVGIRACEPDYRLINKYQDRHVIHWIISGEGWCNGVPIEAGNVIYLKNHIPYNFSSNPKNPCVYAWITFSGDQAKGYLEHMGLLKKFQIFETPNLREIYSLLYDIIYVPQSTADTHLFLEASLIKLLSLSVPVEIERVEKNSKSFDKKLSNALSYIANNYKKPNIRVHDVAYAIGISENYFRNLFKKEMGVSVLEYIIKVRMDAAVTLLLNSNYNISEIAEMTGYADYRQFHKIFTDRFGCSPKQYRTKKSIE